MKYTNSTLFLCLLGSTYSYAHSHQNSKFLDELDEQKILLAEGLREQDLLNTCRNKAFSNICVKNCINTDCLHAFGNQIVDGDLSVNGAISYKGETFPSSDALLQKIIGDNRIEVNATNKSISLLGKPDINVFGIAESNSLQLTNLVKLSPFVVSNDPNQTRYTTIQDAINDAAAIATANTPQVVYLWPGLYNENLVLAPNVNLSSACGGTFFTTTAIIGHTTIPATCNGQIILNGITFGSPDETTGFCIESEAQILLETIFCSFIGQNGANAFESYASNAIIITKNCSFNTTGTTEKCFNVQGDKTIFMMINDVVRNSNVASTFTDTQVFAIGTNTFGTSYEINGSTFFFYQNGYLAANDQYPAITIQDASETPQGLIVNCLINSNHPSHYYATGNGTLSSQGNSFLNSATKTDPQLNTIHGSILTTGNLSFDGGNNSISADGQLIIGKNGSNPEIGTLSQGSNIVITNGPGSITLAALSAVKLITLADSPYTISPTDTSILCDTSKGSITIYLPDATNSGKIYIIKDSGNNAAINPIIIHASSNIDGDTTQTIDTNYGSLTVLDTNSAYSIVGMYR